MSNINSFLIDWGIRFLENKDMIKKEIVSIEKDKEGFDFIVYCKDKVKRFIVKSILDDNIFSALKNEEYIGIFTLNNIANIKIAVSNWEKLANFKFLSIYFINPFSSYDKVWTICPYVHDKICNKSSLGLGLKSMAELVAPIGIEELDNKVKLLKEKSGL